MRNRIILVLLSIVFCMTVCMEAQAVSPYISCVWEYMPAPGQFVNKLPEYEEGDDANDMRLKAEEAIAENARGMISLGGWGGYVVFGFDHMVLNVPGAKDLLVLGNTFTNSSEPGIVMVSVDANGNGKPDDEWYELAGSEYNSDKTDHHYTVTYRRQDEGTKYPQWIEENSITFSGSRLADNYEDLSGEGTYYVLRAYPWGYADNQPNTAEEAKLDIDWAVKSDGTPAHLTGIHFVKVYTALDQVCGWLGETSTEVTGAEDLHPDAVEGIEHVQWDDIPCTKVLKDGTIYISRGGKRYTMQGQSVF
ncbi:MAG: PKD domain-containing protein [Paludibacteraceae bacterium]|nr:PKD domain-containing protein [Paludibacteraceae bacterium]